MKYATFKEHSGTVVATAMSQGDDGFWFGSASLVIPFASPPEELGRFVRSALDQSEEGIEKLPAREQKSFERSIYRAMGLNGPAEFDASGRSAYVMEDAPGVLPFQPLQFLGARKGWFVDQNVDPPLVVEHGSDAEIGHALVQALQHFDAR